MSTPTRHTITAILTVIGVLAIGLTAVALGTTGLEGALPLASVTQVAEPPAPLSEPASLRTVRLVIDFGDGVEKHFVALDHKPGMTALDALLAAKAHARGIKLEHTGKGETAFVTRIDDLKNQGAGADKKNWQFFVNDEFAARGPGAAALAPGDVARWVFATWKSDK